jgi:hypothetical protein
MRALFPGVIMLLMAAPMSLQRQTDAPGDLLGVTLIDGARSIQMQYSVASRKGRSGIAAGKQYFVFGGPRAAVRTSNRTPQVQFETEAAFDEPVTLFKLDKTYDRREIRVAKGSSGLAEVAIPRDHVIQTTVEEIGDAPNSRKRYRLTPTTSLRPGEYCLGRNSYTCFDFGVD